MMTTRAKRRNAYQHFQYDTTLDREDQDDIPLQIDYTYLRGSPESYSTYGWDPADGPEVDILAVTSNGGSFELTGEELERIIGQIIDDHEDSDVDDV